MDDEILVTIGGLQIFGRPGLGPFVIVKDGLDGWDDGVPMRGEAVARAQAHGFYSLPRFQGARVVTVTGIILAESKREQKSYEKRISGLLSHGGIGRVQVEQEDGVQWADVYLEGQPSVDPRRGTYMSDFQFQLWSPDPRKFGDRNTVDLAPGAPAAAFHRGNAEGSPVIQINGPFAGGFTITHPGGLYSALGDLGAASWIRVDFNTGRLKLNGNDRTDLVTRADTCTIRPGAASQFTLSNGSGYVEVLDTYI